MIMDRGIIKGDRITLHFSLGILNGEMIDSTFDKKPAKMNIGDGNLPSYFEQLLIGMTASQEARFKVKANNAFGARNPDNIRRFSRNKFSSSLQLYKGLVISFADVSKTELPGVVLEYDEDLVTIDFNHPLAGLDLDFQVKILSIEMNKQNISVVQIT